MTVATSPADALAIGDAVGDAVDHAHAPDAEVAQRIVDATYRVIERTGHVDPTVRDILREAGLSTPAFYRHFRSKDELFTVLLADGRRRLAVTVERRLARARTGEEKVRAWITAVLAQARDPEVASRTRPFMAHVDRLAERYPLEQRASEQLLVEQLAAAIAGSGDLTSSDPHADATAVYHVAFGVLGAHLRARTSPRPAEVDRVVDFACRALRPATTRPTTTRPTTTGPTATKHSKGEHRG